MQMKSRRNFFLTSVAGSALALASAASAADMALKAPPPAPPAWNWTGFYVGGNIGYSWGDSNTTASFLDLTTGGLVSAPSQSFSLDGVIGGGQIGYNWQTGKWVWGLEADIQASGQEGSATFVCPACGGVGFGTVTANLTEKLNWFGTVRGRLGFTVTPDWLVYATGGWAYGDYEARGTLTGSGGVTPFDVSAIRSGWTVGGGVEARIVGNWTGKVEYLYIDPNLNYQVPGVCNSSAAPCLPGGSIVAGNFHSGITDNILRVGVNYKY
jgi:outer membrane immunogenic protein